MPSIFDRASQKVKLFREDKLNGVLNAIPPPFPRLAKKWPGWERGIQTEISAGTGIGKTKVAKYFIITSIARHIELNPDLEIVVRWYALEETEEEFALGFISTMLAVKFGVILGTSQLKSLGDYVLTDKEEELVSECTEMLNKFLQHVFVIDHITNPYGIWKDVRNFTDSRGTHYYIQRDPLTNVEISRELVDVSEEGEEGQHKSANYFVADNPKEFIFIVTDHISLLSPEKKHNGSLFAAMGEWSKKYCLKYMVKRFNYHVINIHQQTADSDKQQFDYKGQSIEAKLLPTLDGLANNEHSF